MSSAASCDPTISSMRLGQPAAVVLEEGLGGHLLIERLRVQKPDTDDPPFRGYSGHARSRRRRRRSRALGSGGGARARGRRGWTSGPGGPRPRRRRAPSTTRSASAPMTSSSWAASGSAPTQHEVMAPGRASSGSRPTRPTARARTSSRTRRQAQPLQRHDPAPQPAGAGRLRARRPALQADGEEGRPEAPWDAPGRRGLDAQTFATWIRRAAGPRRRARRWRWGSAACSRSSPPTSPCCTPSSTPPAPAAGTTCSTPRAAPSRTGSSADRS